MKIRELVTEKDNATLCALRTFGFAGIGLVGLAILVGSGAAEVGIGVGAIITAVGGGIRLKGE